LALDFDVNLLDEEGIESGALWAKERVSRKTCSLQQATHVRPMHVAPVVSIGRAETAVPLAMAGGIDEAGSGLARLDTSSSQYLHPASKAQEQILVETVGTICGVPGWVELVRTRHRHDNV
jgi:hypothetical protein